MQEHSVTLLGNTRPLPDPFFVLASQNPIELEGTYPLPEAQLDRFLFKLTVSDVSVDVLDDIISMRRRGEPPVPAAVVGRGIVAVVCRDGADVLAAGRVAIYRPAGGCQSSGSAEATAEVSNYVSYGASPRAAIAMAEAARAYALLSGRPSVGFEDVRAVAPAVMDHRLILNYKARFDQLSELAIVQGLLDALDEANLKLPADMQIETTGKEGDA